MNEKKGMTIIKLDDTDNENFDQKSLILFDDTINASGPLVEPTAPSLPVATNLEIKQESASFIIKDKV